ncbi:hypothetical protein OIO90_002339 [Microbotryomycetes sp. JL221]|nr:hypothetical protein OIO90_002339 [Microbotryomycetes sp. JL221]
MSSSITNNPYLAILQASFRESPPPTPGYKARIVLLSCFLASLPLSIATLLWLHWKATTRKGEKPFLFKTIKREGGTYIIGSRTILLALLGLNVAVTLGLSIMYADRFLSDFANGVVGYNVCMFVFWLLTFVLGWAFTCSNLQAYLLARQRKWATARRVNIFFVGFGVIFSLFLIGITIWGSIKLHNMYKDLLSNFQRVTVVASQYNGTIDQAQLEYVQQRVVDVVQEAENYIKQSSSFYIAFSIIPVPIALVNIAALCLVFVIHQQRKDNHEMETNSFNDSKDHKGSSVGTLSNVNSQNDRRRSSHRTITDKRLRSVEQALLVDAVAICIVCTAQCVANLWSAVMVKRMLTSSWPKLEATLLLPAWSAGVPMAIMTLVQVVLALQSRKNENDQAAEIAATPQFITPTRDSIAQSASSPSSEK